MKILIMVLSHNDNGIYNRLVETIRATWDSDKVKDIETLYYYNNNALESIKMDNDCLFIPCDDGINNLGYKVLKSFEFILDNIDFDYIYKMNCSSYLNKLMLKDIVEANQRESLYGGFLGRHNDINFASGAGTLLSKDLVRYIVNNQENWDHSLVEDVAIGKMLSNIPILPMDRVSIVDGVDIDKLNTKCYHYRCKNDNNRENDIVIMKELHNRYKINNE